MCATVRVWNPHREENPRRKKALSPEQVEKRQSKAVAFASEVLGDEDLADELESLTVQQYAERTPEHPEAEFKVYLPLKAGFLRIQLTNRRTGVGISGMRVAVRPMENPESPWFKMSCYSNHVILVPPDKNLLLHVTSDGFREWDESVGRGKPLHLDSGTRLTLAVQLEPSD